MKPSYWSCYPNKVTFHFILVSGTSDNELYIYEVQGQVTASLSGIMVKVTAPNPDLADSLCAVRILSNTVVTVRNCQIIGKTFHLRKIIRTTKYQLTGISSPDVLPATDNSKLILTNWISKGFLMQLRRYFLEQCPKRRFQS